jgi:putative acetyltransferase
MSRSWTTRAESPADIPAVRGINLAAFPTAAEADLVDALRADPTAWIGGLSLLAADQDGTAVGHALLTRCHIGDTPALCLAPAATRGSASPGHPRTASPSASTSRTRP